jgi:hypothetical protein
MPTAVLLPIIAVAMVAGCGYEERERAATAGPERDLTLATPAREAEIASPVELQQIQTQPRILPVRRTPRRSAAKPTPPAVVMGPAPVAAPQSTIEGTSNASEPGNDRELLPGRTVTIIPVGSGPSPGPELD